MTTANRTERVLVIEDDDNVRNLIAEHLRKLGYTVEEESSAEGARAVLIAKTYDVVVADVHLPDGDILDVAHTVRARHPEQPFVFITGDHDENLRSRALREDPAAYLLKPFHMSELRTVVTQTIEEQHRSNTPHQAVEAALDNLPGVNVLLRASGESRRPVPLKLYVTVATIALLLLAAAFLIGYLMHNAAPDLP